MITRDAIVAEARRWVGTRYRHQAMVKGVGCDCIGLVAGVAEALAHPDVPAFLARPEWRTYGRRPNAPVLLAGCAELLEEVATPQPGDVLLMEFVPGQPQHFAFLSACDPDYMIHAYASARRVVECRIDTTWRRRIVGAYRLRGVDG